MEGAPDPVAQAFLQKLEFNKKAQLIRARLAEVSSRIGSGGLLHASACSTSASSSSSSAADPSTSETTSLAEALRVERRNGKRKASDAELEDASSEHAVGAGKHAGGGTGVGERQVTAGEEGKPSLWDVMLQPPPPPPSQHHPASPRSALPQGLRYGYASTSYHNYRDSPGGGGGGAYDPYDSYRPHLPASPSYHASPDPTASPFAAPFTTQTRSTPITSSVRGGATSSPRRLGVGSADANLRVPTSGGRYPGSHGSFGRSPSSTFPRPPATAAAANHSYAQGLTTSPIVNSSPKISSARTSIPAATNDMPVSEPGPGRSVMYPSPLGPPGPLHFPPGFGPPQHLPSRLQQHRQRLGGIASPSSPKAEGLLPSPRGHRRTVSSTLSAVVNLQNAQRTSPQAHGPVEEYLTQLHSPGRSPRKPLARKPVRSPPLSAPAHMGRPTNLADISAASALTAMLTAGAGPVSSQRGSTEPSESGTSVLHASTRARSGTPPPSIRRGSDGKPGQEEDAAGMLMFFHQSPSPAKPRMTPRARDVGGPPPPAGGAKGRVLMFGDDEPPAAVGFGAALQPHGSPSSCATAASSRHATGASPAKHTISRSPKKARTGSGSNGAEKKDAATADGGGESGKENHGAPCEQSGDPKSSSSSSSLFSQPDGSLPIIPITMTSTRPFNPTQSGSTVVSSHQPGLSPPSPSGLLTPAPSSLPLFISPARSPSTPEISYPQGSAQTRATPPDHRPQSALAIKGALNPTLAPTAVVQAGATSSWPDFAFLTGGAAGAAVTGSPVRKQVLEDGVGRVGSPVVQLSSQKLGGLA